MPNRLMQKYPVSARSLKNPTIYFEFKIANRRLLVGHITSNKYLMAMRSIKLTFSLILETNTVKNDFQHQHLNPTQPSRFTKATESR